MRVDIPQIGMCIILLRRTGGDRGKRCQQHGSSAKIATLFPPHTVPSVAHIARNAKLLTQN